MNKDTHDIDAQGFDPRGGKDAMAEKGRAAVDAEGIREDGTAGRGAVNAEGAREGAAAGATAEGSGEALREAVGGEYKYGFVSDIDTDIIPQGLNADVVRLISQKKGEPDWLLDFRLRAYEHWRTLTPPKWGHLQMPDIDFQALSYYAAPRRKSDAPKSLEEVDPAILDTFNRLGISLDEQKALSGMAGCARLSRLGAALPGQGGAVYGQFLCGAQQRGVLRRVVCVYPQGGALSDGVVHVLPYQCCGHGPV